MSTRPRGIRNNNPGNIRADGTQWRGLRGDDGAFCIFDKPENGIRAIARILKNYRARGIDTVAEIVRTWAPPVENNTEAYIASVCESCGKGRDTTIEADDYPQLISAIIWHENGQQPYTHEQIAAGVAAA